MVYRVPSFRVGGFRVKVGTMSVCGKCSKKIFDLMFHVCGKKNGRYER